MSKIKFSPNLFLEKQELDRFKKFLDDDGFRANLLRNSTSYGFIRKPNENFTNGLVTEDIGYTISISEAFLINSLGNIIYTPLVQQLSVPDDNTWYWVKISHSYSPNEVGTFSIDTSGNLTCTSLDGSLLDVLRGQPNFPARVRFTNATSNVLEYDVLEVIDNNNAILQGDFIAESNLTLSVVGTFTEGYVPLTSEKDIFQYDYSTITLVQSTNEPSKVLGSEFFMARVKRNGSSLKVEDRRTEIWTTNDGFNLSKIDTTANPLIGVEQITYDDKFTPRDKNIVEICWSFRAVSFSVDLKNNKINISAGSGGIFKSSNFSSLFQNTDFDGWRVYTDDGKYFKVNSSALNGSTIDLYMEDLNAVSFFNDADSISQKTQTLNITPDVEEIEIICQPDEDLSNPADINGLVETRKTFLINEFYGRIPLVVYQSINASYTITYRYKTVHHYGVETLIPNDNAGYYAESQFNEIGYRTGSTRTPYADGIIFLILSSQSYFNFQQKVDIGDLKGVEETALSNGNPLVNLVVGLNKQYQYFNNPGLPITLSADLFINLDDVNIDNEALRDGNSFFLHFKQGIVLNGFKVRIVQGFISPAPGDYALLREISEDDAAFTIGSPAGLFFTATYKTSNAITAAGWIINSTNETGVSGSWVEFPITIVTNAAGGGFDPASGATLTNVNTLSVFRYKKIDKTILFQLRYYFTITGGGGATQIQVNLSSILTLSNTIRSTFRSLASDNGGNGLLLNATMDSGTSYMKFDQNPAANFVAGTYDFAVNGVLEIQ